jgi:hypothetical protein
MLDENKNHKFAMNETDKKKKKKRHILSAIAKSDKNETSQ